jgi:signal transduction histidine kinase
MKRILFKITYFLMYPLKVKIYAFRLVAYIIAIIFILRYIYFIIINNGIITNIDYFIIGFLYFMLIPIIEVRKYFSQEYENYEKKTGVNPIKIHQTENLKEYENIRTQFTLHNIKNAVINANNYMDILRKGKMDLNIATENIQVCLDRIDEILEVFKDSDYAQKRTEFRLEELFTTFQMLYHSTMIRRDIQFEVIYQNDAVKSQIVNQSFYDMFQIFNNLVINSRKALEQGEIKQITVFADVDKQNDLIFKVCDTGVGISSSNKSKIFDLKFSTTGGDGIGLVYVKEVLKEMGGDIRLIEHFQNFSTTFEVRIPIQKM